MFWKGRWPVSRDLQDHSKCVRARFQNFLITFLRIHIVLNGIHGGVKCLHSRNQRVAKSCYEMAFCPLIASGGGAKDNQW